MTNFKREIDLAASRELFSFPDLEKVGEESDDPDVPTSTLQTEYLSSPFAENLVADLTLASHSLFADYKSKFDVYVTKALNKESDLVKEIMEKCVPVFDQ